MSEQSSGPRVVLLTLPSIFGARIINRLAGQNGIQLVGVGLSNRLNPKKAWLTGLLEFVRRTGWRYLLYNAVLTDLSWMLLRLSGRPKGLSKGTDLRYIPNVNSQDVLAWLDHLAPDYIVSFFFNQWIGSELRSRCSLGCFNVHPSILPSLRGPDPVFRALQRGLTVSGVSIHDVADELDAGIIRYQEIIDLPPRASVFGLYDYLIQRGADRLVRFLIGGTYSLPAISPSIAPDYSSFPTADEVAAFVRSGGRLIGFKEWKQALSEIQ